jgi:hypothetical protein
MLLAITAHTNMRLDETSLLQVLFIVTHMLQFTPFLIFQNRRPYIHQTVHILHTQMPPNSICWKFYQELDTRYISTSFIYDFLTKNTTLYFTFLPPFWHKLEEKLVQQKDRGANSTWQKFIILKVDFFILIITSYTYISIFKEKQYDGTKQKT